MASDILYLEEPDVLAIHGGLIAFFSEGEDPIDPPGPRDATLLGSAISRPRTSLGNFDKYTTVEAKAAALFHSLVKNHAFHNGNKRTALVSMLAFLEKNGRRLRAEVTDDEIFELVVNVADGTWPDPNLSIDDVVESIAQWLRDRTTTRTCKVSAMRVNDFLAKCEQAGCRIIDASASWRVQSESGSIAFQKSTPELVGSVVKVYIRKLGLPRAGIDADYFQEGINEDADIIMRFQAILRRLAHA